MYVTFRKKQRVGTHGAVRKAFANSAHGQVDLRIISQTVQKEARLLARDALLPMNATQALDAEEERLRGPSVIASDAADLSRSVGKSEHQAVARSGWRFWRDIGNVRKMVKLLCFFVLTLAT